MSLSGSFASMSPSDLLQMLAWGTQTGMLTCTRNDDRRHLFISKGDVVGVTSSRYQDRLGAVLLRLGYITDSQCDMIINQQASNGRHLGEIFIEENVITPEELDKALQHQAWDSIYDLLSWTDGDFIFEERSLTAKEFKLKPIVVSNTLLEGARRIDEINRFKTTFHDPDMVLQIRENTSIDEDSLTRPQKTLVSLLKTPWSLSDVFRIANESDYDIYSSLGYLMSADMIVELKEATEARKKRKAQIDNRLEMSQTMEKKGWFHEALANVNDVLSKNPDHVEAQKAKLRLETEILKSAESIFAHTDVIPTVRHSIASVSVDKLCLDYREGFVFFRIDGITNLKNLRYLTGLPQRDLYIILHKFIRMGLIYLEDKTKLKRQSNH